MWWEHNGHEKDVLGPVPGLPTCLDGDRVAQASLVLVPGDLNIGPTLKAPCVMLGCLLGPQLLVLESHCTGIPMSSQHWDTQCLCADKDPSSSWLLLIEHAMQRDASTYCR